ncbi:c-type cytochrome [Phycisphaera mikurensis]|uniref:Cytochrome c family protein n=1 Tax=Phycisphaera mikurensis (strain NBRC 102666 / KCTC 22515 / FYK2301M01) TaxID=1142394 RepID=I0IB11_PHYMF|nr:c-type cytochrome [Phycisphaera mikurensis]MBB6442579.1 cytochrome c2 [Phycisphaera mikurensis]BAM02449.1 cytochrome c family protein [Phycisphaera mikurensis NBRC 102666]
MKPTRRCIRLAPLWVAAAGSGCGPPADAPPRAPEALVLARLEAADRDPESLAALIVRGRETFAEMECGTCHRFDDRPATGPSLAGVAGQPVRLADPAAAGGVREVTADRAYLWESIVHSQAAHVKGFEETTRMSRYAHVLGVEDVAGLIAWLETR